MIDTRHYQNLLERFIWLSLGGMAAFILGFFIFSAILLYSMPDEGPFYIANNAWYTLPPLLFSVLMLLGSNTVFKRKDINLRASLAYYGTLLPLAFIAALYPRDSGAYLLLFITLIIPPLLWRFIKNVLTLLSVSLNSILLYVVTLFHEFNQTTYIFYPDFLIKPNFLCFAAALVLFIVLVMYYLGSNYHGHEKSLLSVKKETQRILNKVLPELRTSETKYANLVENSDAIIFSLNDEGQIKSISNNVHHRLGHQPGMLLGEKLQTLVQAEGEFVIEYVDALIDDALAGNKVTNAALSFRHGHRPEPVEMQLTLHLSNSNELLGKISSKEEDRALDFLLSERQRFTVDNYLQNAEILSYHLTDSINRYLTQTEVVSIRMSLREILINAIEHGNLEISFEEKTQAVTEARQLELIQERQKDENLQNRHVHIDYLLTSDMLIYRVRDQGRGFDHKKFFAKNINSANEQGLGHGRGIKMAFHSFDRVNYNEAGNEVTLIKHLPGSGISGSQKAKS